MLQRVVKSVSLFQTPSKLKQKQSDKLLWLPDNLSGKILDLQFECDTQLLNKQLILDLLQLYSKAIQFYEERQSQKYKIYEKRMQLFLSKPKIEQILRGRSAKMIIAKQKTQQTLKNAQINSKHQIEQLMQSYEHESIQYRKKINNHLKKQEEKLQERIRKKRTNSNRSTNTVQQADQDQFGRGSKGQKMDIKLLLQGIGNRNLKRVFF